MGCISSKSDINDLHPNLFSVSNVDDAGRVLSSGQLEVTETDLILYQRGKTPVRWPLRCLRRYGFDSEVFTFESGRRCPTGPGIYAFRCARAENLFNLMQSHIQQSRSSGGEDTISREFSVATPTSGVLPSTGVHSGAHRGSLASAVTLVESPLEPNYLEPMRTSRSSATLRNGRLPSQGPHSGPLSPQTPTAAGGSIYYANDVVVDAETAAALARVTPGEVTCDPTPLTPTTPLVYMNLNSPTSPNYENSAADCIMDTLHLYVNVEPEKDKEVLDLPLGERHCYANLGLGPGEGEPKPPRFVVRQTPLPPVHAETPPAEHTAPAGARQVHYIVLDLDQSEAASSQQSTPLSPAAQLDSPTANPSLQEPDPQDPKGYATIDFNKTAALSHSVKPALALEGEGIRKTRHNSAQLQTVRQNTSSVSE